MFTKQALQLRVSPKRGNSPRLKTRYLMPSEKKRAKQRLQQIFEKYTSINKEKCTSQQFLDTFKNKSKKSTQKNY